MHEDIKSSWISTWKVKNEMIEKKIALSTQKLVIPSCQGDSIIFQNENFLQLKGVLLIHPPLSWSKERAHTTYSINKGIVIYNSLKILDFTHVPALIAVPWASPRACNCAHPRLKGQKEDNSVQIKRDGCILGIGGLCKKYKILLYLQSRQCYKIQFRIWITDIQITEPFKLQAI